MAFSGYSSRRARAYQEMGADVIYMEAVQSREEVKQIRAGVKCPLVCSAWAMKPYPTL